MANLSRYLAVVLCALVAGQCLAGAPQKWTDLPEPVRKTVLANGGTAGMSVDKESEVRDGKAVFEAGVKDKDGNTADLVITEDGKLADTKHDDADDAIAERKERAEKVLAGAKFTHPRDITNPYLPLSSLKHDVLEGMEDGKKTHIDRTPKPDVHKTFKLGGQEIEAFAVEDRETENGKRSEIAIDYFVQDDNGTVYYLGEDVDEYENGKIISHDGAWLLGRDTPAPGVIFPGEPKSGMTWRAEDVSADISEVDEIVSMSETVKVPAGTFKDCIKVKESNPDGTTEYKYYANGIGVVREVPHDGDEGLISHEAK
jgi:hypothetical protein